MLNFLGNTDNSMVPWETQSINTLPENFIWERDKTFILAVSSGLYNISFGFFG